MFALPPAARQTGREEQPAGPTVDTPTDRPRDPRSLLFRLHYCNVFIKHMAC